MSAAVSLFVRPQPAPRKARRSTVTVHYPDRWAVRPNPRARELGAACGDWLRARGIEAGRGAELGLAELGNWPFPFAEGERAETVTRWMALWGLDERGAAWAEVDAALAGAMSEAWMARHRVRRAEWGEGGLVGTIGERLAQRRTAAGWRPMLDLIEYEIGWELPAAVDRIALEEMVCDCLSIVSDLFGYRHGWAENAVACAMREFGDEFGEAFKWVGHVHSGQVRKVKEEEARLLARYPEHPMLLAWLEALHCFLYGMAQWHSRTGRCAAVHEADGWTVQLTVAPACPDPF